MKSEKQKKKNSTRPKQSDKTARDTAKEKFFNDIAAIIEQRNGLADLALPWYTAFAEDVEDGYITDIKEIEWELSFMLDFCFDDRILALYKKVLRKIFYKYPETVHFYVYAYKDMYDE